MITKIDLIESELPDLTGNSAISEISGTLYIVGNARSDGNFSIYKSTDYGKTISSVQTIALPTGTLRFDPTIAESGNVLHIIGAVANSTNPLLYDIVKYNYDTVANTVSGPITIVSASKSHSGYDILVLASGVRIITCSVWDAINHPGYSLLAFELDTNDNITSTTALFSGDIRSVDTYGSMSLVSLDGVNVTLFYTDHLNNVYFKDITVNIYSINRTGAATWATPNLITSYQCRYTDDRLTASTYNGNIVISQTYYVYSTDISGLVTNSIYGIYNTTTTTWLFTSVSKDTTSGYGEINLLKDAANNLYLAILNYPIVNGVESQSGNLRIFSVNTSTLDLTEIIGHFNSLSFSGLRGSKDIADITSKWLLLGYQKDTSTGLYNTYYVSNYNLPPVIVVSPTALTATRGVQYLLDASMTYDPDLDPMTFTWSSNDTTGKLTLTPSSSGTTATVYVDKTIGPAATTINVTLQVTDNINPVQSVIIPLTIPFNSAPVIHMPATSLNGTRNATLTITPTISDADMDTLTYLWSQTAGTTVPSSDVTLSSLIIDLIRTNPAGETLTFSLTVSDGVNTPVSASINVVVPALDPSLVDNRYIKSSTYADIQATTYNARTISLRNTESYWSTLVQEATGIKSDYTSFRISKTFDGNPRRVYISPKSATVFQDTRVVGSYIRKRVIPYGTLLDAIQTEDDATILLVSYNSKNYLMRYTADGYALSTNNYISDYPDQILDLSTVSNNTFTKFYITNSYLDTRIFLLTGVNGILLVQTQNSNISVVKQNLFISTDSNSIYGSNNISFIRFADLESVNSGKILIGSIDNTGQTYETMLDLGLKRIVNTWDKNTLINQYITTGEILSDFKDQYSGRPSTPVLNPITTTSNGYLISWTQKRPDLIQYYELELSVNGGAYSLYQRINSGVVQSYIDTTINPSSNQYDFRIRSGNSDGVSNYSNTVQIGNIPATIT